MQEIKTVNDWGHITTLVGGAKLRPPKGVDWNKTRRNAVVQWPDGMRTEQALVFREHNERVDDMEHEYEAHSIVPCFTFMFHGMEFLVDLDQRFKVDEEALGTWLEDNEDPSV